MGFETPRSSSSTNSRIKHKDELNASTETIYSDSVDLKFVCQAYEYIMYTHKKNTMHKHKTQYTSVAQITCDAKMRKSQYTKKHNAHTKKYDAQVTQTQEKHK